MRLKAELLPTIEEREEIKRRERSKRKRRRRKASEV